MHSIAFQTFLYLICEYILIDRSERIYIVYVIWLCNVDVIFTLVTFLLSHISVYIFVVDRCLYHVFLLLLFNKKPGSTISHLINCTKKYTHTHCPAKLSYPIGSHLFLWPLNNKQTPNAFKVAFACSFRFSLPDSFGARKINDVKNKKISIWNRIWTRKTKHKCNKHKIRMAFVFGPSPFRCLCGILWRRKQNLNEKKANRRRKKCNNNKNNLNDERKKQTFWKMIVWLAIAYDFTKLFQCEKVAIYRSIEI